MINVKKMCATILLTYRKMSARDVKTSVQPPAGPPELVGQVQFSSEGCRIWSVLWVCPFAVEGLAGQEDCDGGEEAASGFCLSGAFLFGENWGLWGFFSFFFCLSLSLALAFVKILSHFRKLYPASQLPFPNNLMDVSGTGLIRGEEG